MPIWEGAASCTAAVRRSPGEGWAGGGSLYSTGGLCTHRGLGALAGRRGPLQAGGALKRAGVNCCVAAQGGGIQERLRSITVIRMGYRQESDSPGD